MSLRRAALAALLASATLAVPPAFAQPIPSDSTRADGQRSFVWGNGDSFTGRFKDGKPNGPGTFRTASGQIHSGIWREGCLVTADGYRIALFTDLKSCPTVRRRHERLPQPDHR